MSYTSVIRFAAAWGEYVRCTPNAMQYPLVPVGRPDVNGMDLKKFAKKPERFQAITIIFGTSQANVIARIAQWQAAQATVQTLQLPQGYVPNVVLEDVRKIGIIIQLANSTNGATHMQRLALAFSQTKEDA